MKKQLNKILIINLLSKNKGFTLIELLVVVIFVGVLSAVALPNYVAQIGKARETEAKTGLGAIAHSQQAYHFETQSFYSDSNLQELGVNSVGQYYSYTADNTANGSKAIHTAYATDPDNSGARDFSIGVYYSVPNYSQTLCIASSVDENGTTSSVIAQTDGSCSGGNSIH